MRSLLKVLAIITSLIILASSAVSILFLSLREATYWLVVPTIAGLAFPLLRYYLFKPLNGKTFAFRFRSVLKSVSVVYLFLLVNYLVLYYAIPLYIMPYVDSIKRRELPVLVQNIIGNSSDDLDKAYKIYMWERLSLVNAYSNGIYGLDNFIILLGKPPLLCIRITR